MNKKVILLSLLIIVCIVAVSGCIGGNLFNNSDDKNITLIKESTEGSICMYDDVETYSVFRINGVLRNLPSDVEGYTLRSIFYDENKKFIDEDEKSSLKYIAKKSEKSEPIELGCVSVDGIKNASIVELQIYNPDGIIVFDKNITFNMEKVDTKHSKKINKTQEEIEKEKKDAYFNSKEFNDSYWNSA